MLEDFFKWLSAPWMPEDTGGFSGNVDMLNGFILAVCYFFTALIGVLMIYFCIKYKQTDKAKVAHGAHHSTAIEIGWTLPPLVIVVIVFALGFTGYMDMSTPPQAGNAFEIRAEASKWAWNFYYPNGAVTSKLYVPANRPTRITLESKDVLHSLYLPTMRAKKDVVPGRYNIMWFEPDASVVSPENPEAEFPIHCTEYCGQGHSQMNTVVVVVDESAWDAKLAEINVWNPNNIPPVELGKEIYAGKGGCNQCHSVDGSPNTGPTWKDMFGAERQLAITDGPSTITVDDNYILESIRYPNRKKSAGFAGQNMSAFGEGQLNAGDVYALIQYMKSLSEAHKGEVVESFPDDYDGTEMPAEGESSAPAEGSDAGEGHGDAAPAPEMPGHGS